MSAPTPPRGNPLRVETKYQTYKAATASVARWLARQAQKLGIRSGGGKEAHRDKSISHGLSIDDFFAFTKAIVDADPRIGIPLEIVTLAGKAYSLRKEWAEILHGQDEESDKRHAHFIGVIGQVFEKLQAHYQAGQSTGAPSRLQTDQQQRKQRHPEETIDDSKNDRKPANLFGVLSVEGEELSDQEDDVTSEVENAAGKKVAAHRKEKKLLMKKKKSKARRKKAEAQASVEKEYEEEKRETQSDAFLDEGEVDPYFVIMCLLSDLSSMRNFVKQLWTDYAHGKVDLVTASLTTNAAFDIIRTYKQDCPAIAPLLKDHSKTLELVFSRRLEGHEELDKIWACFFHPEANVKHFDAMCSSLGKMEDLVDLTCAHAFYFFNGPRHDLISVTHQSVDIGMSREVFGELVLAVDRNSLEYRDRLMHDIRLLTSFAQDVYIRGVQDYFLPDHFTMQLREFLMTNNKTVSLLQAFGAQMYLDMQNLPGIDLSSALSDLQLKAGQLDKTVTEWQAEEVVKRRAMWDEENNLVANVLEGVLIIFQSCGQHLREILTYKRDFGTAKNAIFEAGGMIERFDAARDRSYLQKNPLLCGVILFTLVSSFRQGGQLVSSYPRSIFSAGQLYFACRMHRRAAKKMGTMRETGVLRSWAGCSEKACWADMEFMFEMVGEQAFFDGNIPTSNQAIAEVIDTFDKTERAALMKQQQAHELEYYLTSSRPPQLGEAPRQRPDIFFGLLTSDAIAVSHELFARKYGRGVLTAEGQRALASAWTEGSLLAILGTRHSASNLAEGSGGRRKEAKEEGQASSHVALLETLKRCLMSESRALHFDMLRFHMRCVDLLTTLRGKALKWGDEVSRLELSELFDEDDKKFFSLGKKLFMTACMEEICTGLWPKKKVVARPIPLYTSRALVAMDNIMQDYLTANDCRSAEIDKVDTVHGIGKGKAKDDPVPAHQTVVAEDPSLQVDSAGGLSVSGMSWNLL